MVYYVLSGGKLSKSILSWYKYSKYSLFKILKIVFQKEFLNNFIILNALLQLNYYPRGSSDGTKD